ncbi:MAG: xanthine dehydrogenase family protein subunit M [Pseudomonadota bacterium]
MYTFSIARPSSLAEAQSALGAGGDVSALAGGQTLIPTLKFRLANPDGLVDLGGIAELRGITVTADAVTIGAMTRHSEVAASAEVAAAIPALAYLAGCIGDPAVRNRGTIGGSVANNDPAADYPAACLGLGATIHTTTRAIAADDFFQGMFETALNEGEIITSVSFPRPSAAGYGRFSHPASRYAMVAVMVAQTAGGVRVAVTGAGPGVFRVPEMEAALAGNWSADALAGIAVPADGLNDDMHGSASYRAHLVSIMAEDAVRSAA